MTVLGKWEVKPTFRKRFVTVKLVYTTTLQSTSVYRTAIWRIRL